MSNVDHPAHYNLNRSGIEAIVVCEMLSFNLGNAFKYVVRREHKGDRRENIEKAIWYAKREMARWEAAGFNEGGPSAKNYPKVRTDATKMANCDSQPFDRILVCLATAASARDGRDRLAEAIKLLESVR